MPAGRKSPRSFTLLGLLIAGLISLSFSLAPLDAQRRPNDPEARRNQQPDQKRSNQQTHNFTLPQPRGGVLTTTYRPRNAGHQTPLCGQRSAQNPSRSSRSSPQPAARNRQSCGKRCEISSGARP